MKCHLCGTYLHEGAPLWNVGGRRFVQLHCIDQRCAAIRVINRCVIEVILPDEEVMAYRLLIKHGERWFRIWARKNQDYPDDTAIYSMDVGYPGAEGHEKNLINVPRYYPIDMKDDLKTKSVELIKKFRTLLVFS